MIEVLYFASIRESFGRSQEQVPWSPALVTVADLMAHLAAHNGDNWHQLLQKGQVLMAVNQTVARADTVLRDGDEVAFFPPVTGG